jgi:hypothetical protein
MQPKSAQRGYVRVSSFVLVTGVVECWSSGVLEYLSNGVMGFILPSLVTGHLFLFLANGY